LTSIEQFNDAAQVAEKVIAAFSTPHRINGHLFPVTLSIGASIYPDDSGDVDTMFKHADTAMYHAKNCGRNNYQFFHSDVKDYDVKKIVKER
jgi:diguanylate cyclase